MLSIKFLCFFAIVFHEVAALKCRTGSQQMDLQFEKIIQLCQKRASSSNVNNSDARSMENSSSEDEPNEDVFSKKFLSKNNKSSYGSYSNNGGDRNGQNGDDRNGMSNSYSFNRTNGNWGNSQGNTRRMNNQRPSYSRQYQNKNPTFVNVKNGSDTYFNRDQGCMAQCFFNEFNVVDQRGFPVRDPVTRLMTQNIQDPELRDFIKESITECFRYLQSDSKNDNCEYSQHLLTCLADKGKEKCEDWDG